MEYDPGYAMDAGWDQTSMRNNARAWAERVNRLILHSPPLRWPMRYRKVEKWCAWR